MTLSMKRALSRVSPASRSKRGAHLLTVAAGVFFALTSLSGAEEYRLSPQDKVKVRIAEWRAAKNEYHEWSGVGGEYTLSPSGTIQIPLVGEIEAGGRTTAQVAESIANLLQQKIGMVSRPVTTVDVLQFRPVYVVGDVEKPGEYTYRPGLTVLQAVGVAGGLYRMTDAGLMRLERDRITAQAAVEASRIELKRTYSRRARLQAELSGADEIAPPAELQGEPDAERLLAGETEIMRVRRDTLRTQREVLKNLKDLLSAEVESLNKKVVVQTKQVELARQELGNVNSLVQRGLAVTSREFTLERTVADLESRLLDLETAVLRAKQGISDAVQKELNLENGRRGELINEMQQVEGNIEQLTTKLAASRSLLNEAVVTAPMLAAERWNEKDVDPIYTLVRRIDGRVEEIAADEFTSLKPDDIIKVSLTKRNESMEKKAASSLTSQPTLVGAASGDAGQ